MSEKIEIMTPWEQINKVFEEADKLKALEQLYMERGDVTAEQARAWALKQWSPLPSPTTQQGEGATTAPSSSS